MHQGTRATWQMEANSDVHAAAACLRYASSRAARPRPHLIRYSPRTSHRCFLFPPRTRYCTALPATKRVVLAMMWVAAYMSLYFAYII